jgi:hypothetical protein
VLVVQQLPQVLVETYRTRLVLLALRLTVVLDEQMLQVTAIQVERANQDLVVPTPAAADLFTCSGVKMSVVEATMEGKIQELKRAAHDLPQVSMPTKHYLVNGMYARQILIPAHTAFVGRKHRIQHYFMCLKGGAMVTMDDGTIGNIKAGMVLMCQPGSQRIGVTYDDTIFVTVHRTQETDLPKIEDECVELDPTSRYGVGNEILELLPEKL